MDPNTLAWITFFPISIFCFGISFGLGYAVGGPKVFGIPPLSALSIPCFGLQWIAFIPAFAFKTEKFYDLVGSATYLTMMTLALLIAHFEGEDGVTSVGAVIASLVMTWALRLGYFLFKRVLSSGKDKRFDEIKLSFPKFFVTWTLQGLWVFLTVIAALTGITASENDRWNWGHFVGLAVWAFGFIVEVISDNQKQSWRKKPENKGKWIEYGLWSISRHPNYVGEVVLWTGIMIITASTFTRWGQVACVISPIFVFCLIYFVSGVPMLEKGADEKWGNDPDYQQYKKRVPVMFPYPCRSFCVDNQEATSLVTK